MTVPVPLQMNFDRTTGMWKVFGHGTTTMLFKSRSVAIAEFEKRMEAIKDLRRREFPHAFFSR
jgi:hypothetical protein